METTIEAGKDIGIVTVEEDLTEEELLERYNQCIDNVAYHTRQAETHAALAVSEQGLADEYMSVINSLNAR